MVEYYIYLINIFVLKGLYINMKVLILTVSTGEGHNSAASAIEDELKKRGAETRTLDACYYVNRLLGFTVSYGYLLSIGAMSHSYSKVYGMLEHRKRFDKPYSPTKQAIALMANKLSEYVNDYDPDTIVCTHVFAALCIEHLKEKGRLRAKTIGIVTDFTVHPYWEELRSFDRIVIPSSRLGWQCLKKGLKKKQILPLGIPVKSIFKKSVSTPKARVRLGLMPDKPVVMVMGGSMGYGDLKESVEQIDKLKLCFQIVVVCGNNEKAFQSLSEYRSAHKLKVLGYTNEIPLIMDASDCIVTKPGGITVSEALAKGLPLILTKPIPGHEERNMEFLMNSGAAMGVSRKTTLQELVWQFFSEPKHKQVMAKAAKTLGNANSAEDLAKFIIG